MAQSYDLVLRGGTIVDGTGRPGFTGDIGVDDGKIVAVGVVDGEGIEEIDASGRLVTPGFVDIHTHYDGHATWTNRLDPSSQHGVTTVLTGNCGVGFAPCRAKDRDRLIHLMEGVEDIPEVVMAAGLPWNWESFPDYLDSLDGRQFDMDVATQLPHAPLRVFVMGERAMTKEPATDDDIARMRAIAREAIEAGALGFSTSRSLNHKASDGTVTPTYAAASDELAGIAGGLREAGGGVLQFISDFDDLDSEFEIARRMTRESGRPLSMSVLQLHHAPDRWRKVLDRIEAANDEGLEIKGQVSGRPIGLLMGFRVGRNPFMATPAFREIAGLGDDARIAELRTPERRARILAEFPSHLEGRAADAETYLAGFYEFGPDADYEPAPSLSMAARAAAAGQDAAAYVYDLLVAGDADAVLYLPAANYAGNSIEAIRTMLASERTILGLGDGGAHVGMICDASLPTYMIRRWSDVGRGHMPIERVVRALTSETASAVGLHDRGTIAPGYRADLNIIDPAMIRLHIPHMVRDLPNGAGRLGQPASGYDATIVAGKVTYRNGIATGALPGRLVRGARSLAA
ncbi:N-acyl-D-amino-acid deacylase family protein [Sphingomonas bacterium]|uniref:N-acyl-D-amino-acid deacylase family protein n=1 Tax=Sphingomonas bacterium TaxID=1895847 RepID=UPI0015767B0A|nr:amidohydrolase family protein [Sphingomonas bacterium]